MKWFIVLILALLPVITCAEDERDQAAEPTGSGAPAVESPVDSSDQEPARDAAKSTEPAEKAPEKKDNAGENSGVTFRSIDELNKMVK